MTPSQLRRRELLAHYQAKRDPRVFAGFVAATRRSAWRFACALASDRISAEDLLQSAYLTALESIDTYDSKQDPQPWLLGILFNCARHAWRHRDREAAGPLLDSDRAAAAADPVLRREVRERVEAAIEYLSAPYREVTRLHLLEDLPPREIAKRCGRPAATVRVQLSRGLQMLRRALPPSLALGAAAVASLQARVAAQIAAGVPAERAAAASLRPSGGPWAPRAVLIGATVLLLLVAITQVARPRAPERGAERTEAAASASSESDTAAPSVAAPASASPRIAAAEPEEPRRFPVRFRFEFGGKPAASLSVALGVELDANASILSIYQGQGVWPAITDARGEVTFPAVPVGTTRLWFDDGGRAVLPRFEVDGPCEHDVVLDQLVYVEGSVRRDRAPVAGAEIWVGFSHGGELPGRLATRTDADGAYRFGVGNPASITYVWAVAPGAQRTPAQEVARAAGVARVDFELQAAGPPAAVLVRSPRGEPVADAAVTIHPRRPGQTVLPSSLWHADAAGRVTATGLGAGEHLVTAAAPGYGGGWAVVDLPAAAPLELDLSFGGTLSGRVRGWSEEAKAERVELVVGPEVPGWETISRSALSRFCPIEADGSFVATGLTPGRAWASLRSRLGQLLDGAELIVPVGGTCAWDPVLAAHSAVRGRVVDDAGAGLEGAYVGLHRHGVEAAGHFALETRTGADGVFRLPYVAEGRYRIVAHPEPVLGGTYTAWRDDVRPGDRDLVLRLPPDAAGRADVRGRLLMPSGEPAATCCLVGSRPGMTQVVIGDTTANGDLAFRAPPGPWELTVVSGGYYTLRLGVRELVVGAPLDLGTLVLPKLATVVVETVAPAGHQPEELVVELDTPSEVVSLEQRDASVPASFWVSPGTWRLRVHGRNVAAVSRILEPRAGETHRETVALTPVAPLPIRIAMRAPGPLIPIELRLHDLQDRLLLRAFRILPGEPGFAMQLGLAPGRYRYLAVAGHGQAEGAFDVPGPPLRLQIR